MGAEKIPGSPSIGGRLARTFAQKSLLDTPNPQTFDEFKRVGGRLELSQPSVDLGAALNKVFSPVGVPAGMAMSATARGFGASPETAESLGDFSQNLAPLALPESLGGAAKVAKPALQAGADKAYVSMLRPPVGLSSQQLADLKQVAREQKYPTLAQAQKVNEAAGEQISDTIQNAPQIRNLSRAPVDEELLRVMEERPFSEDAVSKVADSVDRITKNQESLTPQEMWELRQAARRDIAGGKKTAWEGGENAARIEALQGVYTGAGKELVDKFPELAIANKNYGGTAELIPYLEKAAARQEGAWLGVAKNPLSAMAPIMNSPMLRIGLAKMLSRAAGITVDAAQARLAGALAATEGAFASKDAVRDAYNRGDLTWDQAAEHLRNRFGYQ
jgi:hypothetical protein